LSRQLILLKTGDEVRPHPK